MLKKSKFEMSRVKEKFFKHEVVETALIEHNKRAAKYDHLERTDMSIPHILEQWGSPFNEILKTLIKGGDAWLHIRKDEDLIVSYDPKLFENIPKSASLRITRDDNNHKNTQESIPLAGKELKAFLEKVNFTILTNDPMCSYPIGDNTKITDLNSYPVPKTDYSVYATGENALEE